MTRPTGHQGVAGPGDDAAAAKRRLREQVLARRDALAGAQRLACGEALRARLVSLPVVARATTILCFASFRSEIDTAPLLAWCLEHGIAVALPRIIGPRHMEAFAVTDPQTDLVPGRHDIPEPAKASPWSIPP